MKQRDDKLFLRHILEAIAKIEEYTLDVSCESFIGDSLIQDGVIRKD